MGSGIAQVCAVAGLDVILHDTDEQTVRKAIEAISDNLHRMAAKGKLPASEATAALERIKGASVLGDLSACQFLIEAATENVEVKKTILCHLEGIAGSGCIIATNTSSVSITKLAAVLTNPDRLIGMHFFNPVPLMGLVEVIRGVRTSSYAFDETVALARKVGKTVIDVKNAPGFVVNRILIPMINEAVFVLQEGLASAEDIDAGMRLGAHHPIGPLALADLIGLDTLLAIMDVFFRDFADVKYRPAPLLREMVDAGYLGRKTKRGFFIY